MFEVVLNSNRTSDIPTVAIHNQAQTFILPKILREEPLLLLYFLHKFSLGFRMSGGLGSLDFGKILTAFQFYFSLHFCHLNFFQVITGDLLLFLVCESIVCWWSLGGFCRAS